MSLVIPFGFAQAKFRFRLSSDPEEAITTCGLDVAGAPDPTDPDAIALSAATAWITSYPSTLLFTAWTFVGVDIALGQADDDPDVVGSVVVNQVGTKVAGALPQNCASLVHKRSSLGGQRGRGRFYLPSGYLTESEVDGGGLIFGSTLTGLQTAAGSLLASFVAEDLEAVLLHAVSTAPVPSPTPDPSAITSLEQDPIIATQRRRLRP